MRKFLFNFYVIQFVQCTDMAGDIAICHLQLFLDRTKVSLLIDHEDRHDAQSHPAFKCLVQIPDEISHFSYLK